MLDDPGASEELLALFTAHDLRYKLEECLPALYTYLHKRAQRNLGPLKYNADEVDLVVEHVIEQLVRLGLAGGGDKTPPTTLDSLTDAQFYAFLNRSVRNKAIDRLRRHTQLVSTFTELEDSLRAEGEENLVNEIVEPVWGSVPFATPEEIALKLVSVQELRDVLKQCIEALMKAPHQLQAVLQELEEIGATELLQAIKEDLKERSYVPDPSLPNISQHKDHAHRKLRICVQAEEGKKGENFSMIVASRLTEYGEHSARTNQEVSVNIQTLAQRGLSEHDVRTGLEQLTNEGILNWHGEETVHLTVAQRKQLARFHRTT